MAVSVEVPAFLLPKLENWYEIMVNLSCGKNSSGLPYLRCNMSLRCFLDHERRGSLIKWSVRVDRLHPNLSTLPFHLVGLRSR